jgi:hypothetical protein
VRHNLFLEVQLGALSGYIFYYLWITGTEYEEADLGLSFVLGTEEEMDGSGARP